MVKIDKNTSQALSLLRLPLAFLIVAGHANTLLFPLKSGGSLIYYDFSLIKYPIHFLSQVAFSSAVPLFFIISGFLFFVGLEQYGWDAYKQKIQRRAKTLFLPYMVWNIVYLIPMIASNIVKHKGYDVWYFIENLWICPDQVDRIARMEMSTPADPPLWFIRDLIVCMVLSPLVWFIIRRKWLCIPILTMLFIPWVSGIQVQYPFPGISIPSILFFSTGAAVAYYKVDIRKLFDGSRLAIIAIGLYCILAVSELVMVDYHISMNGTKTLVMIDQIPVLHGFLTVTGCLAFLSVSYWVVRKNAATQWGGHFLSSQFTGCYLTLLVE